MLETAFRDAATRAEAEVGSVARALVDAGVRAVVGTADWVSDRSAADFAAQLLAMLARGKSLEEAFESACAAVPRHEGSKWRLFGERSLRLPRVDIEPGFFLPPDPPGVQRCPYFLDRARELTEVSRLLDSGPKAVIWLGGEGGLGKTVLAAETARRNAWRFSGGVAWVAFDRSPPTLEAVLQAAEQVGPKVEGEGVEERARNLASLAARPGHAVLFVLDNLDTVLDAHKQGDSEAGRVLEWVRQVVPPARVLVTSRENPLLGAAQDSPQVDEFPDHASIELFWEAAGGSSSGLDRDDPECLRLVTEICHRLGGLPLAIELVGARARETDLQTLRDDLEEELDTARLRGVPERHRSLEAALSSSFAALRGRPQVEDVLPVLAAFPAGANPAMLDALLGKGSWKHGISALSSLSISRLLRIGAQTRWYLVPPVRHFALLHVEPAVIQRTRRKGTEYLPTVMAPDHGDATNAAAAMSWVKDLIGPRQAFGFGQEVGRRLYNRGFWTEADVLLRDALDMAQEVEGSRLAMVALNLGWLAHRRGDLGEAGRLYRQSLRIREELDDRSGVAISLQNLGRLAHDRGELDEAGRLYRQSLTIREELGSRSGMAASLHNLGRLAHDRGELEEAARLYRQSLSIREELGNRSGMAASLHSLGLLAHDRGELEEAGKAHRQSLAIYEELGDRSGLAVSLHNLGLLAHDRGDLEEAARLYRQSLRIREELGNRPGVAASLHNLGRLARDRGEPEGAERLYRQSLKMYEESGNRSGVATILNNLGLLAHDRGQLQEAERLYRQSLKTAEELGHRRGVAISMHNLGRLSHDRGQLHEAERLLAESLKAFEALRDPLRRAINQQQLGKLAHDQGRLDKAEALLRDSLRTFEELGSRLELANSLRHLGRVCHERGDLLQAETLYRKSLDLTQQVGCRLAAARALHQLAALAHDRGQPQEAEKLYRDSLKVKEEVGDRLGLALSLHHLGELYLQRGDTASAQAQFAPSLQISLEAGAVRAALSTYGGLVRAALGGGDQPQARRHQDEAASYAKAHGPEAAELWAETARHLPNPPPLPRSCP